MVCYGCFAFFLLLGGLLVTLVGYYPLDMDHTLGWVQPCTPGVGQIVTFFAYRPPSRPLSGLPNAYPAREGH